MKNKCWIVIILMSFIGLASCSSVPKPITHKFTTQTTIEAAQHWEVLAQDFAKQAISAMEADPLWISNREGSTNLLDSGGSANPLDSGGLGYINPWEIEIPPIYLQTNDLSEFGRTFRNYLITEITKLGYPIAHSPEGAVKARWSVNKVYHNADRTASRWPGTMTGASLIGYGIYKLAENSSSAFPAILAGAVAVDLLDSTGGLFYPGKVPHTEIVLTFTVSKDEKVLSRQTQAYYVNAEDFNHYSEIADFAGQESHFKPVRFRVTN
jgi:hypothetical protein